MKEQFVPYDLAIKLKELGFDEQCFGYWTRPVILRLKNIEDVIINFEYVEFVCQSDDSCLAPLWQQAFDWFRERHRLLVIPINYIEWYFEIHEIGLLAETVFIEDSETAPTYNAALPKALEKLIEIVKTK